MLNMLQEPIVLFVRGNPHVLGGAGAVTNEVKTRVMARMCNWFHLAQLVIDAEFPYFDLCNAFCMFGLGDYPEAAFKHNAVDHERCDRLAKVFNICPATVL